MSTKKIVLKVSKEDDMVGYLYLPDHPKTLVPGIVKKTISISDLIDNYKSIPIYFDFNGGGGKTGLSAEINFQLSHVFRCDDVFLNVTE